MTTELYEIRIPHQSKATILWHQSREDFEQFTFETAMKSRCDTSEFWRNADGNMCLHVDKDGNGYECGCHFDYEYCASNDLHTWDLVDIEELRQIASGDHIFSRGHQGALIQSLAIKQLDIENNYRDEN